MGMTVPLPVGFRLIMPGICLFALGSAVAWGITVPVESSKVLIGLIIAGNIIDQFAVDIRHDMRVSAAHFVAPFAIVADSVTAGLIAGACCMLGRLFSRGRWKMFDVAVTVAAASVSGLLWQLAFRASASTMAVSRGVFACAVTLLLFTLLRSALTEAGATVERRRGRVVPDAAGSIAVLMAVCATAFTPALAYVVTERGDDPLIWTILLIPVLATQFLMRAFRRERDALTRERRLNQSLEGANHSLESANLSLTESLVTALDARDRYTSGHSVAVAVYARDIAVELGMDDHDVSRIYLAGLLHDIGKIAVPVNILAKDGKLEPEEFAQIKEHPVTGEAILRPAAFYAAILPAVRHHHERMDGRGYPDGLPGADIPLDARVLAVADAYNAMTSDRPYRDGMDPAIARDILIRHQGTQHDKRIVAALERVLDARDSGYARAAGPDFDRSDVIDTRRTASAGGIPIATLAMPLPPEPDDVEPERQDQRAA